MVVAKIMKFNFFLGHPVEKKNCQEIWTIDEFSRPKVCSDVVTDGSCQNYEIEIFFSLTPFSKMPKFEE